MCDQPADALGDLGPEAAPLPDPLGGEVGDIRHDAGHQDSAQGEAGGSGGERQGHPHAEEEGTDRWTQQQVAEQERAADARVGDPEVHPWHDARHEAAAAHVGEDLRRPEDEQRQQDDGDADRPADDGRGEDRQHGCTREVDPGDDPTPVEPVGNRACRQAEQQVRELLGEQRHRHQQRVVRQGGDEQRPGSERDPVADVRDDRRGQQPAKAAAELHGRDGFGDSGREEGHRAEDSNAPPAQPMDRAGSPSWSSNAG